MTVVLIVLIIALVTYVSPYTKPSLVDKYYRPCVVSRGKSRSVRLGRLK